MVMTIRESPVVAVAELVIRLTPGPWSSGAIQLLGHRDKPFLVARDPRAHHRTLRVRRKLSRRRNLWAANLVFVALAVFAGAAVRLQPASTTLDLLPVAAGLLIWLVCLPLLTARGCGTRGRARG